ncbi:NAD(P)/FAD-dependent oxidoreductase [Glycomyces algeriensis]|uniref:Oxidoreductase n=1 Tax=Glycomyces algeriensis TaxID=256037 RepID=A0A9W6GAT1_9ACTN|nr:FAD-dependent oxidoreductase [Glycomyces algeriensis]MDA1368201.1 FAD-dependent oxidoreductase [Glycomyces algeriensis]MDR7351841.1 NADH dehydrogenase FAD-containing subunit [Glycomyces algeriensis]GLI44570.1 oxidoreductase [Glycomyces algeriensis]
MQHRIVVLGAGYAGTFAAGYLARHLHHDDVEVTAVNAEPDFVERFRLHQVAAGQQLKHRPLAKIFGDQGVRFKRARVTAVDADQKTVAVDGEHGLELVEYDTLVYSLGSTAADHGVPGVAEHAHHITSRPAALRLRDRLDAMGEGGKVLFVGGNLTAIEGATEIAESHPELHVSLTTSGELGGWLAPKSRQHLMRVFDRLGIEVHEHTRIERVDADGVVAAGGSRHDADATVWAAGFAVHPIAAASGLAVEANGQITVDRQMRSVSHPDVYAAGDAAFIIGENGQPLPMSCASAGFTSQQATAAIIGDLTGRTVKHKGLPYVGNHISLGRRDGILQVVDGDVRSRYAVTGRTAARLKESILKTATWGVANPTFAMPSRTHRTAVRTRTAVAA